MKSQKSFFTIVGIMTLLGFLLAACSAALQTRASELEQSGDQTKPADSLPADIEVTIYQGDNFQEGQVITLSEILSEGKPLVLNFWAALCPPCRLEMPDFQEVYEEYQGQIVLLGLDVGPFTALGSREGGQTLLQELGITYPAGTTFDDQVIRSFEVLGMPTTFFITPQGEVFEKWTGILTSDKMGELVEGLFSASSNSS
ncbi:MAG: TlpA disulfide reductase family protein [Anaerolineales bacterium]